jgi:hypothetical protein
MTERNAGKDKRQEQGSQESNLEHIDQSLDIMERHSAEVARVEEEVQEDMRRWDREYKDARLHSVPKPRKHQR